MRRTKYTKLDSSQKLEIIEYWMKNHYSYSVISETFKNKWKISINPSTVADIIQHWKKTKEIRGSSTKSNNAAMLTNIIIETIQSVNELGYTISKECLHAICIGEFMDWDINPSSVKIEDVESIVMEHQVGLSMNHPLLDNSITSSNLHSLFHSTPLSNILILDSCFLFFRSIPFKSTCYSFTSNTPFREKMEILVTFAADGSFKSPAFIYGHRFYTSINSTWSVIKRKKRRIHTSLSISTAELAAYLAWLDQQFTEQHVVLMRNFHHLIQSITNDTPDRQTIHFQPSENETPAVLELHHLQVLLVPPVVFAEVSPFNQGIQTELIQGYRARLLQELIQKQQNNRGYKRQLPIETCYELLCSAWDAIPARFIAGCCARAKLCEAEEELEWFQSASIQFQQALLEFHKLFKGKNLVGLTMPMYSALEMNPFLAGVSCIFECLRDKTMVPLLFNHGDYPTSNLFPEPSYYLRAETEAKDEEVLFQEEPLISQSVGSSSQLVEQFCTCLDGLLMMSSPHSNSDMMYYSQLKQRLRQHYCK